jgi:hypothetical protein
MSTPAAAYADLSELGELGAAEGIGGADSRGHRLQVGGVLED